MLIQHEQAFQQTVSLMSRVISRCIEMTTVTYYLLTINVILGSAGWI